MAVLLMTWFGTIVCYDRLERRLAQRRPEHINDISPPVHVSDADPATGQVRLLLPSGQALPPHTGGLSQHRLHLEAVDAGRTVRLHEAGRYLCAHLMSDIVHIEPEVANDWETYLLISPDELDRLGFILRERWVFAFADRAPDVVSPVLGHGFQLQIGTRQASLSDNLPFFLAEPGPCLQIQLFFDHWKLEKLMLIRPLVYSAAFGSGQVFEELKLSLESLQVIGGYTGDVMVFTDRTRTEIEPFVPKQLLARLQVVQVGAANYVEFCRARYLVATSHEFDGYQPCLYVDPDVVFDRALEPTLVRIVLGGKLSAQREIFSPLLTGDSVGSALLAEDDCHPGARCGFNAGIMAIPSVTRHRETLLSVLEVMRRYGATHGGRAALFWYDQSVANYIAYKGGDFDLDLLTPSIRLYAPHGIEGGTSPQGLVHCWGPKGPLRLAAMRECIAAGLAESTTP